MSTIREHLRVYWWEETGTFGDHVSKLFPAHLSPRSGGRGHCDGSSRVMMRRGMIAVVACGQDTEKGFDDLAREPICWSSGLD